MFGATYFGQPYFSGEVVLLKTNLSGNYPTLWADQNGSSSVIQYSGDLLQQNNAHLLLESGRGYILLGSTAIIPKEKTNWTS